MDKAVTGKRVEPTRNEQILRNIYGVMDGSGKLDASVYNDAFGAIRLIGEERDGYVQVELAHELLKRIAAGNRYATDRAVPDFKVKLYELMRRVRCYCAPDSFDDFMLYLEINRPIEQQFWLPRRKQLLPIVNALQEMEEGNLDELFLSQPPRTGKTTLMVMFLLWVMGRDSEKSNLYCSYTDSVVRVFYNGLLEIINDKVTYNYSDVFPKATIAATNANDLILNLERKKRYASFTGRSLYGTLNGACDCNGYCIADDLHSGIEEILSADRVKAAWDKVDNNLIPRIKMGGKLIWEGTRWSITDCIARRKDLLENDPKYEGKRWRAINVPALDENDESNFDYDYGVGFSTQYFLMRRASFERNGDMASWLAQYQGEPIEREGAVFSPDDMRTYNGVLPEGEPDRVFMVVDPSWGGGDNLAAVVVNQYGDDLFVPEVIFSNEDKTITQPMLVSAIERNGVTAAKIEGTKTTASYGEDIDKALRAKNIRINLQINTSHWTTQSKRDRIIAAAPDIRAHMIFLQEGKRPKEYSQFMQNMYAFTFLMKKNAHDDAPDVCAMTIDFAFHGAVTAVAMRSPFRR